ncbi:hypothetical protein GY45DRAFT_1437228 [Cubamyces sp. BRFM 1775]|nr:hypothetical protein GY45DRAFT_1437228 [Cubamyces sp. BRFM 1775]
MHHLRAKRRASLASSSSASPLPAAETQPIPVTGGSRGQKLVKTSLKYLIPALQITKEMSSVCPQLQLALGMLLKILETYKGYSEATEAICALLLRIHSLNEKLGKVQSEDNCPPALKERLDCLASQLQEVIEDANKVRSERRIVRFFNAANNAQKTESWIKKLDQHISDFSWEGIVALELTVHQHFDAMSDKIAATTRASAWAWANGALQRTLQPVIEALLHNGSSVHVQCHKDTRKEVLETLRSWLRPEHPTLSDQPILWLHGLTGSGKSTIALTIANQWDNDKLLGASFFCARDGDRSNVNCIFRRIAYKLTHHIPAFREQLTKVLETDPDLYSSNPTRQLEKLIVAPLQAAQAHTKSTEIFPSHVVVVIDALDECTDNNAVSIILESLAMHIGRLSPLKFLITSHPEVNITRGFLREQLHRSTQILALDEHLEDLTRRDITMFLRSRLATVRDDNSLDASWPAPHQLDNLVSLSELLFIFAALAARYIEDPAEKDPEGRLRSLLDAGNAAAEKRSSTKSPFFILDALYIQVLAIAARNLGDALKARLKLVLGTIVLAEQRLSATTLDALLDLPPGTVRRISPVFSAILIIPHCEDDTAPIRI